MFGDYDDYEKIAAFSLISSVLCGNNESPLKKVILNNGLGEDISFDVQDGLYQPFAVIDVTNTDAEKEESISEAIRKELERIIKEGLNKEELEANLNQREFKARERDFGGIPKGLVYGLTALDSWLYGGDPVDSICFGTLFDSLREKIHTTYYEDLIQEYILNSRHHAKLLLKPSNTLGKQKREAEEKKLQDIASKWNEKDRKELVSLNRDLQEWQASEDTPEQKATLPALHLEDLNKEPTKYPFRVEEYEGHTVLMHDQDSNAISYVNLFAEVNDLELNDATALVQMLSLLGKLKTEHYDVLALNRKMKSVLGDFSTGLSPFLTYHEKKQRNVVSVYWSSLCRNDEGALDLIEEILYKTDFSDRQAVRD
ncbi:MAG: insulinase family protein, partial [Erysipelotrichaceae bacterium]|nr:insulinase family protein [Erysipelotrichaceae bacterium]